MTHRRPPELASCSVSGAAACTLSSSGLIDIHSLTEPDADVDVVRLPWFGPLPATPVALPTPPHQSRASRASRGTNPLHLMIGTLAVAVVGSAIGLAHVSTSTPQLETPTESAALALTHELEIEDLHSVEQQHRPMRRQPFEAQPPVSEAAAGAGGDAKPRAITKRTTSRGSRHQTKSTKPTRTKQPKRSPAPVSADCILDRSKCAAEPRTKPATAPEPSPTKESKHVRLTLSNRDLRAGFTPTKSAAKQCGRVHGADPGERVTVKLSVAGSTGRVLSAKAQGTHSRDALGKCVAAALAKAEFPSFEKPQIGVVYGVRM